MGYVVQFYNNTFKQYQEQTKEKTPDGIFENDDKSNATLDKNSYESIPSIYTINHKSQGATSNDFTLSVVAYSWRLIFGDGDSSPAFMINLSEEPSTSYHVDLVISQGLSMHNSALKANSKNITKARTLDEIAILLVYYAGGEGDPNLTVFARDTLGNDLISPKTLKLHASGNNPLMLSPSLDDCPITAIDSVLDGKKIHHAVHTPSQPHATGTLVTYAATPGYTDCPPNTGKDLGSAWVVLPDNGHPLTLYPRENVGAFKGKKLLYCEIRYATFPCWIGAFDPNLNPDETERELAYQDGAWIQKDPDTKNGNSVQIHGNSFCFVIFVYGNINDHRPPGKTYKPGPIDKGCWPGPMPDIKEGHTLDTIKRTIKKLRRTR